MKERKIKRVVEASKCVPFQRNINGKVYGGRYTLKECNKRGLFQLGRSVFL